MLNTEPSYQSDCGPHLINNAEVVPQESKVVFWGGSRQADARILGATGREVVGKTGPDRGSNQAACYAVSSSGSAVGVIGVWSP